jgi:serine/threonine-protein kinase RIO1
MLRRKRNSLTSGNCTLRDGKEAMVFWAKRWSALEGEQLDEWQLYVEGRERSYGTCAGRRDGLAMLLEGEQLDEWQLYVEGRERSYGTFAGR